MVLESHTWLFLFFCVALFIITQSPLSGFGQILRIKLNAECLISLF